MSPRSRMRYRRNVVLHMVMTFIIVILLGQLWLFTVALESMEESAASSATAVIAFACSFVACAAVWTLTRFFLRTERKF